MEASVGDIESKMIDELMSQHEDDARAQSASNVAKLIHFQSAARAYAILVNESNPTFPREKAVILFAVALADH
jgi:hypothetical protein